MPLECEDATGKPRSDRDIEAAIKAVMLWIVKEPMALDPDGFPKVLHLTVILDALRELMAIRSKDSSTKQEVK